MFGIFNLGDFTHTYQKNRFIFTGKSNVLEIRSSLCTRLRGSDPQNVDDSIDTYIKKFIDNQFLRYIYVYA